MKPQQVQCWSASLPFASLSPDLQQSVSFVLFYLVLKTLSFTKSLTPFFFNHLFSIPRSFTHFDSVNKGALSALKSRGASGRIMEMTAIVGRRWQLVTLPLKPQCRKCFRTVKQWHFFFQCLAKFAFLVHLTADVS